MNFKGNKLVLLFLAGIILIIGYFVGRHDKAVAVETFRQFDSTNINGIISYVGIKYHGACFKLKGDENTYIFRPSFEHKLDGMHDFTGFAKPGDKVVKESYGDTLYLIKGKNKFRYTFMKITNEP